MLVTVANLGSASIGEVRLVSSVEYLIAELDLVFLQSVDVILKLGQLWVESFLLWRQLNLRRKYFLMFVAGREETRTVPVS